MAKTILRVVCRECGVQFETSDKRQRFCSHACGNTHRAVWKDLDAMFLRLTDRSVAGGCWLWLGRTGTDGYAEIAHPKHRGVHRLSYEHFRGEIPAGMSVLHRCDNRPCVNPAHLFLGTQNDNIEDMRRKGRQARGAAFPNTRLTEADVRLIRASAESNSVLAKRFGVTPPSIYAVRKGISWRHVDFFNDVRRG